MLRHLLITASLVVSGIFVTGTAATKTASAATTCASSAQQTVVDGRPCQWRVHHQKQVCRYCWNSKYQRWVWDGRPCQRFKKH
jgi:hypothetical protein